MATKKNIRLVHITNVPWALRFLSGQVGYIRDQGFEVHCLSSAGSFLKEFGRNEGVHVHQVDMVRTITPLRDIFSFFKIYRRFRQIRPHIVHAHTPKGGFLGMLGAYLAGVPVRIYHLHGLRMENLSGWRRFLLRMAEKAACRLAHVVPCVSHELSRRVVEEGVCTPDKAKVFLSGSINGVDARRRFNPSNISPDRRKRLKQRFGIDDNAVVIGYMGRIVRDKGLVELAEAWKSLCRRCRNVHLLVAGPFEAHDPLPADIERILSCDKRVHLTGEIAVEDTPAVYSIMDVFVLPSYREGLPVVAIEASAMRLPVVATRVTGMVEAVEDNVTGKLVPVRNSLAIEEALYEYVKEPELRTRHGDAGRRRVLDLFRPEPLWEAVCAEYRQLLGDVLITPGDR